MKNNVFEKNIKKISSKKENKKNKLK